MCARTDGLEDSGRAVWVCRPCTAGSRSSTRPMLSPSGPGACPARSHRTKSAAGASRFRNWGRCCKWMCDVVRTSERIHQRRGTRLSLILVAWTERTDCINMQIGMAGGEREKRYKTARTGWSEIKPTKIDIMAGEEFKARG